MFVKGCAVVFMISIELDFCVNSRLFPKCWDRASDLYMWKKVTSYNDDLFSFTEIGSMSFRLYSSCIIPSSSNLPAASSNEHVLNLSTLQKHLEVFDRPLHKSNNPPLVLKLRNLSTHVEIPVIASPCWVSFGICLAIETQIIIITEIIALFKQIIL